MWSLQMKIFTLCLHFQKNVCLWLGSPLNMLLVSEVVPISAVIQMVLCGGSTVFVCGGVRFKHILKSEAVPVGAVILMVLCGRSTIFVCGGGPL